MELLIRYVRNDGTKRRHEIFAIHFCFISIRKDRWVDGHAGKLEFSSFPHIGYSEGLI